ncbi:MAG: RNA polymerase sigma factor [Candidatus Sericytochromatia bacterium]
MTDLSQPVFVETPDIRDEALMLQCVAGQKPAFNLLVKRWKHPLVNYFYRQLGNAETAEELAQEVFVKVWTTQRYVPQARFSTWLYRVAGRVLIDHWRKQGRRPQADIALDEQFDWPSETQSPEQQYLAAEGAARVRKALQQLPPKQQQILVLSKFQDLKYAHIADILGCSANHVKVQVFRALQRLAQHLKEGHHEE